VSGFQSIDAGYRLKAAVDASFFHGGSDNDDHSENSHYSHNFQLGASYALNGQIMPDSDSDSNWYVSLFGGAVLPDNSAFGTNDVYSLDGKTGFSLGAAVGTELSPGLRGELELSYLRYGLKSYSSESGDSDPASGDVEAGFILANLWKDINLGAVSPYIGGGLGFALARIDDGDLDGNIVSDRTGLSLAGQFGFGTKISFTDRMQADFGYRFKSIVEAMILTDEDDDYDNAEFSSHQHVLQAGLTYNLGPSPSVQPVADLPETPDSFYVSLFGGAVMPLDTHVAYNASNYLVDFKTGFLVGAAVGADISTTLRGELELSHYESKVKDVTEAGTSASDIGEDVKATFLMANLWRDVDLGGFTPYFGGGVGVALMDVDIILDDAGTEEIKDTQLALAAQVGGGLRVPVTDNLTLDAGYRFKTALGVLTEGGFDGTDHGYGSYHSHTGQVGISWKF
jgi:opacity protein-like surface antigen